MQLGFIRPWQQILYGCIKQVPKMLGTLRNQWAPDAFLVSFKLETDEKILISKVCLMTVMPPTTEKQSPGSNLLVGTCAMTM